MQRGVECVSPDYQNHDLRNILTGINLHDCTWHIDDAWELYDKPLREGPYTPEAFQALLEQDLTPFFVRIRRYPINTHPQEIERYQDFQDSPCTLLLICVDVGYYDIYTKDPRETETIYENCRKLGFNPTIKTDANDGRTVLRAM